MSVISKSILLVDDDVELVGLLASYLGSEGFRVRTAYDGESAVRAATENPARSIGVDADYGSLAAGRYGNVVLADDDLNILAVVQKGKVIHDNR